VTAPTDIAILHEIVRIIRERAQVPDKVVIRSKRYQITYLVDHRQRLEEAMRRRDADRLGMLFGQLPGRIRYQMTKGVRGKAVAAKSSAAKTVAKPRPKASRRTSGRS
jgi:hypothetical protein